MKFEKRVWPPIPSTETEKPMVPIKPTVKPPAPTTRPPPPKEGGSWKTSQLKPVPAVKPNVCNIYAAPSQPLSQPKPKPNQTAKPSLAKPNIAKAGKEKGKEGSKEGEKEGRKEGEKEGRKEGEKERSDKRADSTDSGLSSACDKVTCPSQGFPIEVDKIVRI